MRGLLPLIQRCPTSTLWSKKYSDLCPHLSTGVGILSNEMKRGADLPLPNPFQFVRVIDLTSHAFATSTAATTIGDGGKPRGSTELDGESGHN